MFKGLKKLILGASSLMERRKQILSQFQDALDDLRELREALVDETVKCEEKSKYYAKAADNYREEWAKADNTAQKLEELLGE